eukprot:CAMPEP_0206285064 /NCGR_PEP_ID=MMETSP0047_2-20121206/41114_1 /ASSEMBLY_ACC=CAM_ASM_000192 /TAXON_ID=195065 /ORGANISM="Chroomonas mesostigmatica_cf, Strain CCMP1168" /LENGTH=125 /DNA_ID=CAMNT_0053715571 /DNA_START=515 /DNA_END=892 /DNA_ORIENTATION=+
MPPALVTAMMLSSRRPLCVHEPVRHPLHARREGLYEPRQKVLKLLLQRKVTDPGACSMHSRKRLAELAVVELTIRLKPPLCVLSVFDAMRLKILVLHVDEEVDDACLRQVDIHQSRVLGELQELS